MKAAVFETFQGEVKIQNVPDPTPTTDGVVVKVSATGLCRSDWHGWMGHDLDITLPHVPGHELAGTIEAVGKNVRNFAIGDRVTVPFVCGCGSCNQCISGNHQVCDSQSQPGFTHWGSFAEYVALDYADTNLVKLPNEITDITATTLGCRFITSFRAVVAQGKVSGGHFVAVHGCGGVGLSALMIAHAIGAQTIAIDIEPSKLAFAKSLGADITLNANTIKDIPLAIKELTKGGVSVSVDALGSSITCINSILSLRKRGKHIQIGLMTENHATPPIPMGTVIANELEILGSHGMQAHQYPEMLNLITSGKLPIKKLLGKTMNLEEGAKALMQMNEFRETGVMVINEF